MKTQFIILILILSGLAQGSEQGNPVSEKFLDAPLFLKGYAMHTINWNWTYNSNDNDGRFFILEEDGSTVFEGQLVQQPGDRAPEYYTDQLKQICDEHNATINTAPTTTGTHSPAPWNVDVWIYSQAAPPRKELIVQNKQMRIAQVMCNFDSDEDHSPYDIPIEQATANAKLIAAAPYLLEALETWTAFWDAMPGGQLGGIVCDIGLLNDAFLKTTKALKKARTL